MKNAEIHFVVVDDDSVNNLICKMVIANALPGADIKTYTQPILALQKVAEEIEQYKEDKIIMLLDINMPEMSGWEFLTALEQSQDLSHNRYMIFMASSSIDPNDKLKASTNPHIIDFIEKPITKETVMRLSEHYLTV